MLVEGMPHRSILRTSGVSISTVKTRLVDAGNACAKYHNLAISNVEVSRRRPGNCALTFGSMAETARKDSIKSKNHESLD